MKSWRKLAIIGMFPVILACGMAAPIPIDSTPVFTEPTQTVNTKSPIDSLPEIVLDACTFIAVTETNLRECAGLACDPTGETVKKGELVQAICPAGNEWGLTGGAWFCIAALTGTGGCKELPEYEK
jgi:hypothetical protein